MGFIDLIIPLIPIFVTNLMIVSFCLKPKKLSTEEERRKKAKIEDMNIVVQGWASEFKVEPYSFRIFQSSAPEFKAKLHSFRSFGRWALIGSHFLNVERCLCWCGKIKPISSGISRGNHLWQYGGTKNTFWRAWRCARACGNGSIFLFVFLSLPFLPFLSLSSPWQWRAKPIFVGVRCSHKTLV